jgi:hypothetical protein
MLKNLNLVIILFCELKFILIIKKFVSIKKFNELFLYIIRIYIRLEILLNIIFILVVNLIFGDRYILIISYFFFFNIRRVCVKRKYICILILLIYFKYFTDMKIWFFRSLNINFLIIRFFRKIKIWQFFFLIFNNFF